VHSDFFPGELWLWIGKFDGWFSFSSNNISQGLKFFRNSKIDSGWNSEIIFEALLALDKGNGGASLLKLF
jgi:hypothetical protein